MALAPKRYHHTDYSALLKELQNKSAAQPAPVSTGTAPLSPAPSHSEVSSERRKRDRLMGNRKMLYAYDSELNILHDRDCIFVKSIKDRNFRMTSAFSSDFSFCPKCFRRALVRTAISDDWKHLDAYLHILKLLRASNYDLHTLIIENNARFYDAAPDHICIKVHDDSWLLRPDEEAPRLFHNNYPVIGNYERLFQPGFHPQYVGGRPCFHQFAEVIRTYSWEKHVERLKAQELAARKHQVRNELAAVCNYIRLPVFSLFFLHYRFLDCNSKAKSLCRKRGIGIKYLFSITDADPDFRISACRIPRWKRKAFQSAMDDLKEYSVRTCRFDYGSRCNALFPQSGQEEIASSSSSPQ